MSKPKTLILDIETMPGEAYIWSLWDDNIPIDRVKKHTRVWCWAAKWVGQKKIMFAKEGDPFWVHSLRVLLEEADAVVTQNGDKFDLPRIRGLIALEGLSPLPPITSIDIMKTTRKMGYLSSKLDYIGLLFKVGRKVKHEGFELWPKCEAGDERAMARMERYNKQDVRLLERIYLKLRPYIQDHPYLGAEGTSGGSGQCPNCHSGRIQKRGTRRTRSFIIERLQCLSCGAWTSGTRRKVK